MVCFVNVEKVIPVGEGGPWVDTFGEVEACVCVDHKNVIFVVLAKIVKESAKVV